MATKMHTEAEEAKTKGNECVKEKKYIEAMLHYTQAVKLEPRNHLLYSNRSLAFLKVDQYYHALEDACKVIELQPNWPKGYFRKGEVEFKTEHYQDALISYRKGLMVDPDDTGLLEAATRANNKLKEQKTKEDRVPYIGILMGVLSGLLIVLGDDVLTTTPKLNHIVLKVVVFIAIIAVGFGLSKAYSYFIITQRDSLLEPPIDLFSGEQEKSTLPQKTSEDNTKTNNSSTSRSRKGSSSTGRQRYRVGKSS